MSDNITTLLVQGLNGEGPGDIVGAVANETSVDADAIVAINMDDGSARVEVDTMVADRVVQGLNGGRIGNATVSVTALDDEAEAVEQYADRLTDLVELEREEEMRRHEREIRALSGRDREDRGRALLRLRGRNEGEGLGGHLVKFMRKQKGQPLPDTEIRVGDLVMISKMDPLRDDNPTGIVTQVTNYSVTVSFDRRPGSWVYGTGLRMDLYVNDVPYRRMQDALAELPTADGPLAHLRDVCTGACAPAEVASAEIESWHNPALNPSQRQAVRAAVATEDVHLIHGPPGTGKTTTAVEVIQQCVGRGESVLATAASNTAVDNIVEGVVEQGVDVVRLGHPARISEALHAHTLDARIADNETYQNSQKKREAAFDSLDRQDTFTVPSGRWRRGMSDQRIKDLAGQGRGSRGVPAEKIQEMAEWIELREQADDLFAQAERLEREAIDEVLEAADVVCSTNSTAGSDLLGVPANPDEERASRNGPFDTLVIDEATQATAPSCWIPLVQARRAILVGDHKQLPPTILNQEAAQNGLQHTLFERLAYHHETDPEKPDSIRSLLRTQYRMHQSIMGFSSAFFYDGRLAADDTVQRHTLDDLGVSVEPLSGTRREILDPEAPLVFVDTSSIDAPEHQRSGSHSRENPREADVVARLVTDVIEAGLPPTNIAVISPYDDQVDRLERQIGRDAVEVDTVDGFQGREKEAVFISLVRSNDQGRIGFLRDRRRFNVALTRAKRKVVVVGDPTTLGRAPIYGKFREYARSEGKEVKL